jgi:hypothetical protein
VCIVCEVGLVVFVGHEMQKLREYLATSAGQMTGLVVASLLVVVGLWFGLRAFSDPAAAANNDRLFVDDKTGKTFGYTLRAGDMIPVDAPSGEKAGYPATLCYWTADGKIKDDPTYLVHHTAKGQPGPTFCPDCSRLVLPGGMKPDPGTKPPPTKSEYKPR